MTAADHLSHVLFASHFERLHRMPLEQAVAGHTRINDREFTAEEYDEAIKGTILQRERTWTETHAEMMANPDPVHEQLRSWARDHTGFLVGNLHHVASNLVALTAEMQANARPNETTLYRGAVRQPQEESERGAPLSYTEDRHVATSFASKAYRGERGTIFKAQPGEVRGLRLQDYGVQLRTVGRSRRPEAEVLVDPTSYATPSTIASYRRAQRQGLHIA